VSSNPFLLNSAQKRRFRARLLAWYEREKRPLPWRATRDPYRVWISEIMLQQTRVGAVRERYVEFLSRFPELCSLAAARCDKVLAAWSGLGYYRRARALHEAARMIVRRWKGRFPRSAQELLSLPGVGRYTAAAVASIAFGERCAAVDGNVERVLRHLLGWPREGMPCIWAAAEELLSPSRPGDFNQAMMELGATVCLPAQPQCALCPVRPLCKTQGAFARVPQPKRKRRSVAYALATRDGSIYLVRRANTESLMPGMWELPRIAANGRASRTTSGRGNAVQEFRLRHAITVTEYHVKVVRIGVEDACLGGGQWQRMRRVPELPLTGLARRILERAGVI